MTFPFNLTGGFKQSASSPDLRVTTDIAKDLERTAFNLGMGDGAALEASGIMARSNAAIANLNNLHSRKEKDKRLEDLIYNQMLISLNAISAEMDWLEEQIEFEEKFIQKNNTDIDFIRSLNEGNIMDADGAPRSDVQAFLKKHGYNNTDDLALDEVQLILQTVETDLHNDNIIREGRIESYQERHGELREHSGEIAKHATGAEKERAQKFAEREPYQVKSRLVADAHTTENKDLAEVAELQTVEVRNDIATQEFGF